MMWPVIFFMLLLLLLLLLIAAKKRQALQHSKVQAKHSKQARHLSPPSAPRRAQKSAPSNTTLESIQPTIVPFGQLFATEAILNHALKQDPSQYPLYLELLDLYLAEEDQIATQRLLKHIENLQQPELQQQALAKQRAHRCQVQADLQIEQQTIELQPIEIQPIALQPTVPPITPMPTTPITSMPTPLHADPTADLPPLEFTRPSATQVPTQLSTAAPAHVTDIVTIPSTAAAAQAPDTTHLTVMANMTPPDAAHQHPHLDLDFALSPLDLSTWQSQQQPQTPDQTNQLSLEAKTELLQNTPSMHSTQYAHVQRQLDLAAFYLDHDELESARAILVPELVAVEAEQAQYLAQLCMCLAAKLLD